MKKHYVYEIWYPNDMKYIGMRSCSTSFREDHAYKSSSKIIPPIMKDFGIKILLSLHATRELALTEEMRLHKLHNVKDNPNFYNQANQSSPKFNPTNESRRKGAKKLIGRTKDTHQYIRDANIKRRQYTGANQTEAQKLGNKRMGLKQRGSKNPAKGKSGIANNGFIPWYYITPEGAYIEMYDTTKAEFAKILNISQRQLINRFHYTNIDKQAPLTDVRVPQGVRGFVFGNLK